MAETTAEVRRDIELTRERMSSTIQELEQKLNVAQMVRDNPWPALALAVGAGLLLSGSKADIKAAAATAAATKGAGQKLTSALDDVVAQLVSTAQGALQGQVDTLMTEVRTMLGNQQPGGYGVGPVDIPLPERPQSVVRAD